MICTVQRLALMRMFSLYKPFREKTITTKKVEENEGFFRGTGSGRIYIMFTSSSFSWITPFSYYSECHNKKADPDQYQIKMKEMLFFCERDEKQKRTKKIMYSYLWKIIVNLFLFSSE